MVTRRQMLQAVALLPVVTAGCSIFGKGSSGLNTAISDAQALANGLVNELNALKALNNPTFNTYIAKIAPIITDIQTVVTALSSANAIATAQPLIQQIETDVNSVVATVATIPGLPPQITLGFQAAAVLLPFIETAVGMVVSQIAQNNATTATPAVTAAPVAGGTAAGVSLSLHDKALAILKQK